MDWRGGGREEGPYGLGARTANRGRGIGLRGSSEGGCRELGSGPFLSAGGHLDCPWMLIKSGHAER